MTARNRRTKGMRDQALQEVESTMAVPMFFIVIYKRSNVFCFFQITHLDLIYAIINSFTIFFTS